jgi:hypothetical protein
MHIPDWTSAGFPPGAAFEVRPGNPGMCGPVVPLDPALYGGDTASWQPSYADAIHSGNRTTTLLVRAARRRRSWLPAGTAW